MEFFLKNSLLILSLLFSFSILSAGKSENRRSAYNDFVTFMEELSFNAGGPSVGSEVTCSTELATQSLPVCNTREIFSKNSDLFPSDQEYIQFPDGSVLMNPLFSGESQFEEGKRDTENMLSLYKKTGGKSKEFGEEVFERVREKFIDSIVGSQDISTLSNEQKLLIDRIRRVNLTISDEKCETGVWASFTKATYEVSMCSAALKFPEYALVPLLAHEIGHSIDFCAGADKCLEHSKGVGYTPSLDREDLIGKFLSKNPSSNRERAVDYVARFEDSLGEFFKNGSTGNEEGVLPSKIGDDDISMFTDFLENLKNKNDIKVVDIGIPISENPLNSVQKCLEDNFHFKPKPDNIPEMCRGAEFTERGAQIWSSKVTGEYLNTYPPVSIHDKMSLMGLSVTSFTSKKNSLRWVGKEEDFNTIFLSNPNIQNVFNCRPLPTQTCSL